MWLLMVIILEETNRRVGVGCLMGGEPTWVRELLNLVSRDWSVGVRGRSDASFFGRGTASNLFCIDCQEPREEHLNVSISPTPCQMAKVTGGSGLLV